MSFFESGFWDLAQEALEKALDARDGRGDAVEDKLSRLNETLQQIRIKKT
jgi:hypothetical protein